LVSGAGVSVSLAGTIFGTGGVEMKDEDLAR
jgi:hypothetical protein